MSLTWSGNSSQKVQLKGSWEGPKHLRHVKCLSRGCRVASLQSIQLLLAIFTLCSIQIVKCSNCQSHTLYSDVKVTVFTRAYWHSQAKQKTMWNQYSINMYHAKETQRRSNQNNSSKTSINGNESVSINTNTKRSIQNIYYHAIYNAINDISKWQR